VQRQGHDFVLVLVLDTLLDEAAASEECAGARDAGSGS
jgi:hypothetical protein